MKEIYQYMNTNIYTSLIDTTPILTPEKPFIDLFNSNSKKEFYFETSTPLESELNLGVQCTSPLPRYLSRVLDVDDSLMLLFFHRRCFLPSVLDSIKRVIKSTFALFGSCVCSDFF